MTTWKLLAALTVTGVACALAPLSAQADSHSFGFSYSTGKYSRHHGPAHRHGWSGGYSWWAPSYYYCPPPVYYVPAPPPPPPRVIVRPRAESPVYLYQGGRFEVR